MEQLTLAFDSENQRDAAIYSLQQAGYACGPDPHHHHRPATWSLHVSVPVGGGAEATVIATSGVFFSQHEADSTNQTG